MKGNRIQRLVAGIDSSGAPSLCSKKPVDFSVRIATTSGSIAEWRSG